MNTRTERLSSEIYREPRLAADIRNVAARTKRMAQRAADIRRERLYPGDEVMVNHALVELHHLRGLMLSALHHLTDVISAAEASAAVSGFSFVGESYEPKTPVRRSALVTRGNHDT